MALNFGGGVTRATFLRRGAIGVATVAGLLATGACGVGGQASGGGSAAPAASKQPARLSFEWPTYTQPKQDWAEWAIKTYMQKYPNITVEPLWNKNPTEILTTTLASGQPPDVGWFGVGHWSFYQAFKPVEQFMAQRKLNVADYLPKVVEAMKWRGKMLAFPMGINTSALFYNKGEYQKAGLAMPKDDDTFDDLIAAGKRLVGLSDGTAKIWGNNVPYYTTQWPVAYGGQWLSSDGTKVTIDHPRTLQVLALHREMWEKQNVAPDPKTNADIATSATAGFTTQAYAAFVAGTWGLDPARHESFDWDIAEVPSIVDGGKKYKGAFCGTEEIYITNDSKQQDAAADFAAWLISPEHLTYAGNKGQIIPAHIKTAKEAFVNPSGESRPKNIQAFVRAADYAPPIIGHPAYADLSKAYSTALGKFLGSAKDSSNTLTAAQALTQAQADMQRVLDDWNKANPNPKA